MTEQDSHPGTLPVAAWLIGVLAVGAVVLVGAVRSLPASVNALVVFFSEGGMAALVVVAAGGWAWPLVKSLTGRDAPTGLRAITAALVGLWLLGVAVLAVGSLTEGLLTAWVWWPVVGAGVVLAAWQGRKRLEAWHWPRTLDGRSLVWILVAAAVALWIAGATQPPGFLTAFTDEYDVLEYHLQLPREYYLAQHISTLDHNVYSHYPLGVEMLFLLCMCLRGGAYEGMYAAKMIPGAFGVLAAAAVLLTLRRESDGQGRFSLALLATAPPAIYLGWMALVELPQMAYLTVALLWLRQWMRSRGLGPAVAAGAMLGGACAVKYLSVGFVLAPLAVVMLAWPILARRFKLLAHAASALGVAAVCFAPWLVRNALTVGNPVFPLASTFFTRPDAWPAECQQRWIAGHGPDFKPPVPRPEGFEMPPRPTRLEMFFNHFVWTQWFGPLSKVLAALAVCALIATTRGVDPWDWSLAAVWATQLAVWTLFTHGMPPRFLAVAIVPMALLGGGVLARLGAIQTNPFRRDAVRPAYGPWGMMPAIVALMTTVAINLLVAYGMYATAGGAAGDRPMPLHGISGGNIVANHPIWHRARELPTGARLLMVGDAKAFYMPPGTVYATAFNAQPLDEMLHAGLRPEAIVDRLRADGITHLWFDWFEIRRLARTYGFPASLSAELLARNREGEPPSLPIIRRLEALGMKEVGTVELAVTTAPTSAPTTEPTSRPTTAPEAEAEPMTLVTIYALPGVPTDEPPPE